jgi:hypothetical protein
VLKQGPGLVTGLFLMASIMRKYGLKCGFYILKVHVIQPTLNQISSSHSDPMELLKIIKYLHI